MNFFEQFDSDWSKRLGLRRDTFRLAFDYLAKKRPTGHLIVETGCVRQADNWDGDGQSTILFNHFATTYQGEAISVDIDPKACEHARSVVGPRSKIFSDDSVPFLGQLARELRAAGRSLDLLYLDSYDAERGNSLASAIHQLKELCAIAPALSPGTLVMVDDSYRVLHGVSTGPQSVSLLNDLGIGGKAKYVAEYFQQIGVPILFEGYQCGWVIPA